MMLGESSGIQELPHLCSGTVSLRTVAWLPGTSGQPELVLDQPMVGQHPGHAGACGTHDLIKQINHMGRRQSQFPLQDSVVITLLTDSSRDCGTSIERYAAGKNLCDRPFPQAKSCAVGLDNAKCKRLVLNSTKQSTIHVMARNRSFRPLH